MWQLALTRNLSRRMLFARRSSTSASVDPGAFERDGYVVSKWSLPPPTLAAGQNAMDELLSTNPDVRPEQLVNAHLVDGGGSTTRGVGFFLDLASSPEITDMVSACLKTDNVILWACQVFCKPAGTGKSVPWHQDGQYWPIEPLRACTAWIAIDRSDSECGALQVIPGTHTQGTLAHVHKESDDAAISYIADPDLMTPSLLAAAVTLELEAGQVSIHDSMLVHGSARNTSGRRRAGIAATYMPAECHFYRDRLTEGARKGGLELNYSERPLFVVKGSNQNPLNERVHCLVPQGK